MEGFKANDKCRPYFENSYGYAVFESIVKGGAFIVGGAYGDGAVYRNTSKTVDGTADNVQTGTSKMLQVSLGGQLGVETYGMIIFFETQLEYEKFTTVGTNTFEFGADAKVVALTASASAGLSSIDADPKAQAGVQGQPDLGTIDCHLHTVLYAKGMAVFTQTHLGLLYEATISGQKYSFTPIVGSN